MPGNLLTLPMGDTFMYVQPVYTRRAGESNFPILRFVLVSYEGNVGIGETLRGAIADSLIFADDGGRDQNQSPQPTDEPSPTEEPSAEPGAVAGLGADRAARATGHDPRAAAGRPRTSSPRPTRPRPAGDTVRWARLMEQGRRLVDQAVALGPADPDLGRGRPPL